ncbi:uncharacterized protein BDZ99DRAFT_498914 [Mytilinidion resinicola]|uniref:Uncharacterized protein n=1 Tax=Mytilinidion resinicola TaxID=574789 RepID=A0A6A6YLA8_9PEZI|nr:uncharacterized protein BDZ99DRAFT_498914 [Mytilinidion resinicola]KAF2809590.1 hypothetical protein BDZ99DRAFT_498914 [Mytilinidion resinicola]
MSLPQFINPRDLHSNHWLIHDLPEEPAWEDRVGLKIDFMAIQWGLIHPLEDAYLEAAQELFSMVSSVPKHLRHHANSDPSALVDRSGARNRTSTSLSNPERPILDSLDAPFRTSITRQGGSRTPVPTAAPSAKASDLGVDYDRSYTDAEIQALISGWSVPSNATWSQSDNEALIREMIIAICNERDAWEGLGALWLRLEKRLKRKSAGAIRSHWMRHLRAVCGVDERVNGKPESLRTSLNPAQQRQEGLERAKKAAEKAEKEASLKAEKAVAKTESKKRKRGAVALEDEDEDAKLARKLLREDMGMRRRG